MSADFFLRWFAILLCISLLCIAKCAFWIANCDAIPLISSLDVWHGGYCFHNPENNKRLDRHSISASLKPSRQTSSPPSSLKIMVGSVKRDGRLVKKPNIKPKEWLDRVPEVDLYQRRTEHFSLPSRSEILRVAFHQRQSSQLHRGPGEKRETLCS